MEEIDELVTVLLSHPNAFDREDAVKALGETGDERAIEPLIAALHDPSVEVRWQAARALSWIGSLAVQSLIAALRDPIPEVRWRAACALGEIADPIALPELERLAQDDETPAVLSTVADMAQWAIEEIRRTVD